MACSASDALKKPAGAPTTLSSSSSFPVLNILTLNDGSITCNNSPSPVPVGNDVVQKHGSDSQLHLGYEWSAACQNFFNDRNNGDYDDDDDDDEKENYSRDDLEARFVGMHLGMTNVIGLRELTRLFHNIERRFRLQANNVPEFTLLSLEDKESLIVSNAPVYFQLHLANYFNAGCGLQQLKLILASSNNSICNERLRPLVDSLCSNFLTITLRYFAELTCLFKQPLIEELFEALVSTSRSLSHATLRSEEVMSLVVPCILFNIADEELLENPRAVAKARLKYLHKAQTHPVVRKINMDVASQIKNLRSAATFYATHSAVSNNGSTSSPWAPLSTMNNNVRPNSYYEQCRLQTEARELLAHFRNTWQKHMPCEWAFIDETVVKNVRDAMASLQDSLLGLGYNHWGNVKKIDAATQLVILVQKMKWNPRETMESNDVYVANPVLVDDEDVFALSCLTLLCTERDGCRYDGCSGAHYSTDSLYQILGTFICDKFGPSRGILLYTELLVMLGKFSK